MFLGSTALEVAIGMVFIYLLLSLLCSTVGEYIEATVNNRARYLRRGIDLLLNESAGGGVDLAERLYAHGLIRPLYRNAGKPPSYIPARTFALALWNMATTATTGAGTGPLPGVSVAGLTNDLTAIRAVVATQVPNPELRTAILTLIDEADGDINRARRNIEEWYEGMMERVSGWYKRRTAVLMLVIGSLLAAGVNADSITIAMALARDGALRSSVAAAAEQRVAAGLPQSSAGIEEPQARNAAAAANLRDVRAAIDTLGLPIGWVRPTADNAGDPRRMPIDLGGWLIKLFGLLLTGFAIAQGSPFWFDLLNKFMVARSTVKPAERPRDPATVPAPVTN